MSSHNNSTRGSVSDKKSYTDSDCYSVSSTYTDLSTQKRDGMLHFLEPPLGGKPVLTDETAITAASNSASKQNRKEKLQQAGSAVAQAGSTVYNRAIRPFTIQSFENRNLEQRRVMLGKF